MREKCSRIWTGTFYLSKKVNFLELSLTQIFSGNVPHSVFLKDIFRKIPAFPREECFPCTVKKMCRIPVFFLPNISGTGKPLCWQGIFWCPPEKEFFVFWGGKSIPLSAGVIFSSLMNVIFPYFPYFPIKFTGKLLEDSWLATGAPSRVAIKFGGWEKNLAPFVKLQVWNSVKILVNQSYYYREN